jgi:hypothetical protein
MITTIEKAPARQSKGLKKKLDNHPITLKSVSQNKRNLQRNFDFRFDEMHLVCDECCAPLWLAGANFIESHTNGRANVMRALCDLHAEEFGLEVAE